MIRVAVFFVVVGLIALGVAWLADRPGDVSVVWLGWRVETSLMVLLAVMAALVVGGMLLFATLRGLWRSPARAANALRGRREAKARHAITRGLIAVGAGDARAARRHADDIKKLSSQEPLALLLAAQSAQLGGDRAGAEQAFREMAKHPQTKLLGLRGLFIEAQRNSDLKKASLYAEEAARIAPALPWAGQAVMQLRCATGDWVGALDMLENHRSASALDRASYKRQRAVLLTARALSLEETDRDASKALVFEAAKLAPDLVPAVALAARYLAEDGELRKASRMIERTWQIAPHPDLAETYAYLRFGDSARDRLVRVQKLASLAPDHLETALALSRAAIDARDFALARRTMQPYLAQPSRRVALLMSELEQADSANEGRAREWTARAVHAARDPAWTADGFVSDRWLPISPLSGRIDAFEWKAPPAEIGGQSPEAQAHAEIPAEIRAEEIRDVSARPMIEAAPAPEPDTSAPKTPVPAKPAPASAGRAETGARIAPPKTIGKSTPRVDPVVPLAHVPDDPGPDAYSEPEPAQDQTAGGSWKRMFL